MVTLSLGANPPGDIVVPVVVRVGQSGQRGLDVFPPPFVVEPSPDEFGDEGAPPPGTGPSIQLGDQLVLERYVYTHVLRIAHSRSSERRERWSTWQQDGSATE